MHQGTCVPDVVTCSALISCCEKAGVWQPALCFLAMMHVTRLQLSVVSSTSAMSAAVRVQRWQQTLQVFHHMQRHELQPNVIGFSAAMTSCEVGSQWHLAPSLFQDVGMSWQQLRIWKSTGTHTDTKEWGFYQLWPWKKSVWHNWLGRWKSTHKGYLTKLSPFFPWLNFKFPSLGLSSITIPLPTKVTVVRTV